LTVEALKEFVLSLGASKTLTLMDPEKLWNLNKNIIDPVVPRYTAIAEAQKCLLILKDGPAEPQVKSVLRHKKNPDLGNKQVIYTSKIFIEQADAKLIEPNEEVTLVDWGNAIIDEIKKDQDVVVELRAHLHLEGSVKTTKKKLTWLPDSPDIINVQLVECFHLITKKKIEEDENWEDFINPQTKIDTPALGDPNLRMLKKGESIQLERRGYFICDEVYVSPTKPLVLLLIPDGHTTKEQSVLTAKKKDDKKEEKADEKPASKKKEKKGKESKQ